MARFGLSPIYGVGYTNTHRSVCVLCVFCFFGEVSVADIDTILIKADRRSKNGIGSSGRTRPWIAHTHLLERARISAVWCVCVCPRLYTVQCQHLLITFCICALCVCICFVVSSASARAAAASRVQQIFDLSAGGSGFDRQNCVLFFDAPVQCFDCSDSDRMRVLVSCDCASAAMAVTMLLTLTVASSTGSRHRRQAGFSLADLLAQENGNTPNSNPNNEYNYYTGDNQGKRSALLLKLFIT